MGLVFALFLIGVPLGLASFAFMRQRANRPL